MARIAYRFDLEMILGLAVQVRRSAASVELVANAAQRTLGGVGRSSYAMSTLGSVVEAMEERGNDHVARSDALTGMGFDFLRELSAASRLQMLQTWDRLTAFSGSENDPLIDAWLTSLADAEAAWLGSLSRRRPAEVAAAFAGIPSDLARRFSMLYPEMVAATDGVPLAIRAAGTRRVMEAELARLVEESDSWSSRIDDFIQWPAKSQRDVMVERIAQLETWLASDRVFLWYSSDGDGQAIELIGNAETADAIGVFVPGIGSDLAGFDEVAGHAGGIFDASQGDGQVAMIAWLGYDAPEAAGLNIDAATRDNAREGYPSLVDFVEGLAVSYPTKPVTVVAHSYGSVLAGWAMTEDHLDATNVVLVGSPNTPAASVDELHLPTSDNVFVGEAPGDVVVSIGDLTDGWSEFRFPLGHGYDPGDCEFGATVFAVQDVGPMRAHSTYSSGASAMTIVRIMLGQPVEDLCG